MFLPSQPPKMKKYLSESATPECPSLAEGISPVASIFIQVFDTRLKANISFKGFSPLLPPKIYMLLPIRTQA